MGLLIKLVSFLISCFIVCCVNGLALYMPDVVRHLSKFPCTNSSSASWDKNVLHLRPNFLYISKVILLCFSANPRMINGNNERLPSLAALPHWWAVGEHKRQKLFFETLLAHISHSVKEVVNGDHLSHVLFRRRSVVDGLKVLPVSKLAKEVDARLIKVSIISGELHSLSSGFKQPKYLYCSCAQKHPSITVCSSPLMKM